jgi:hypothetical protein
MNLLVQELDGNSFVIAAIAAQQFNCIGQATCSLLRLKSLTAADFSR